MNGAQALGWVGTIGVLGTYTASLRRGPYVFHVGNFFGSCLIAIACYDRQAWPSLVLTVCFGAIGFVGAVRTKFPAPATEEP